VATWTPASALTASTTYLIRVTTAVQDASNNALATQFTTANGFTTAAADVTPPTISSTTPANAATGISTGTTIAVTFNEAMSTGTVTAQTSAGTCSGSVQVSLDNFANCIAMTAAAPTFSGGNTVATFTPGSALTASTTYKIRVTTAVQDASNNALAAQFETATGFTTGAGGETQIYLETFETCTKSAYAVADTTGCTNGQWNLDDALIGTTASDRKNGTKSVRARNPGTAAMTINLAGAKRVRFNYGKYGTDADTTLQLQSSIDSGGNWVNAGSAITVNSATLTQADIVVNFSTNVRFRILKTGRNDCQGEYRRLRSP
jgi:hypothetical protein